MGGFRCGARLRPESCRVRVRISGLRLLCFARFRTGFCTRGLLLDPTLLHTCDQRHSSRESTPLTVVGAITCVETLKVNFDQPIALTINSCHCTDDVTTLKVTFDQPIALTINSCHCTDDVTTLKATFDQPIALTINS